MRFDPPPLRDPDRERNVAFIGSSIRAWIWLLFLMVLAMVVLGGITRLTGSGLSMVQWRPLMGTIPPMSHDAWIDVFAQYQRTPQFEQVNHWMTLDNFRSIFMWEYLHRLLGRLVGVIAVLPWLYFRLRRKLPVRLERRIVIAIILGGCQGLLGWYMVQSGLVDRPEVSHYRLAAHLSLALFVGMWLLWTIFEFQPRPTLRVNGVRMCRYIAAFIGLCGIQIVYGAFMAGTRAGFLFNTFPDLNGNYSPAPFFTGVSLLADALESPIAIHYIHRALGWLLFFSAPAMWFYAWLRGLPRAIVRGCAALCVAVALQFLLGVLTVIWSVPTSYAVLHQAGAVALLGLALAVLHTCVRATDDTSGT
ncbi:MAG: COX15/CtaA family protein [Nannocystaceae bacterium]